MKSIEQRQIDRLIKEGAIKPTEKTISDKRNTKLASDISRAVDGIEETSKAISEVGVSITESIMQIVTDKPEPIIPEKKKWEFTISRNSKGYIDSIEAVEL